MMLPLKIVMTKEPFNLPVLASVHELVPLSKLMAGTCIVQEPKA